MTNPTASCPNCGATEPNINLYQPTPDEHKAGARSELDCLNCEQKYAWQGHTWTPK